MQGSGAKTEKRPAGDVVVLLGGGGSGEIASAGSGQVCSYADVLRKILQKQNTDALGTNADPFDARYQELERKFLDGSIAENEFEELRKLENGRKASSERPGGTWRTEGNSYVEWDEKKSGDIHETARFFEVNGTKRLSPIIKRGTIKTQGGFECFPDGDPLKQNVQNVKPITGFFDVAMHGEPDVVCFGGTERNMTARVLASVIRHSEGWDGQNIRLLSCNTGKKEGDSPCFAEELATALGVTVQAPNKALYIFPNGTFQIGKYGEGEFVEYKPNERRRFK